MTTIARHRKPVTNQNAQVAIVGSSWVAWCCWAG
jgi:hypothetical protein